MPKRILITGAASGIGRACAEALAAEGAELVLVDRDGEALDRLGLGVAGIVMDVADPDAWPAVEARLGALDGVIACAGVADAGPIAALDFAAWRRVLSINLDGMFLTVRAGLRALRDGGAMTLVSSAAAVKVEIGTAAYAVSKAGVVQLTKVAAKEAAARGVRVNALLPGGVQTPIWRGMPFFEDLVRDEGGEAAAFAAMARMGTPLGRYATAEETAAQILFLMSPAAATITGAALLADGGYTL